MTDGLRTFCHISEYDAHGYRNLHRMVAASDPLVLWAPSSQLLIHTEECRLTADEFLDYVDNGHIQVVAREEWLTDKSFRSKHGWPGAAWDDRVDGALRALFKMDSQRESDPKRRRVSAVLPEAGWEEAESMIAAAPAVKEQLIGAYEKQRRDRGLGPLPPGTFQTAVREGEDDSERSATAVLRDAINHGDAIAATDSDTAILLGSPQSVFFQHVASIYAARHADARTGGERPEQDALDRYSLSQHLVALLERLEGEDGPANLAGFIGSESHRELVRWTSRVLDHLIALKPEDLEQALALELRRSLSEGEFTQPGRARRLLATAGLNWDLAELLEGTGPLALGGLAFSAYPVGNEIAQRLGLARKPFSGPNWPFRYTWGDPPSREALDILLRILDS